MIWVMLGRNAKELRERIEATMHKADSLAFIDTVCFLNLRAETVEEAMEELRFKDRDSDRFGLILPACWGGHAMRKFVDRMERLTKKAGAEVIS